MAIGWNGTGSDGRHDPRWSRRWAVTRRHHFDMFGPVRQIGFERSADRSRRRRGAELAPTNDSTAVIATPGRVSGVRRFLPRERLYFQRHICNVIRAGTRPSILALPMRVLMPRLRQAWPLLVLAIFWIAQVQGTVHAIGHLGGMDGASKHTLVAQGSFCDECAALAQAGAAPLSSSPAAAVVPPSKDALATRAVMSVAAAPDSFYRSRAPPYSPI